MSHPSLAAGPPQDETARGASANPHPSPNAAPRGTRAQASHFEPPARGHQAVGRRTLRSSGPEQGEGCANGAQRGVGDD
jgi:hypothetical protein